MIQTRGIDWDQGRTGKIIRNCGPGVENDLQRDLCSRIKKFVDIPREFSQRRRAAKNKAAKPRSAGNLIEARDHYYIAACFYTNAMWAIYEDGNPERIHWQERKRASYDKFIQYAGRPIERVELPYDGKKVQALLHLPPGRKAGEKVPCVMYIPGMDGVKEDHPASGDPFIERGFALLSVDCPGQGETREGGIKCTASNCRRCRQASRDYLVKRPEIDADRLGVMAFEHGFLLGAAGGRRRETLQSLRRQRRLHGAGPVRDLQHVVADVQVELHVHVRLRRRSRLRRILPRPCRSKASPQRSPAPTWSSPAKTTSTAT